MIDTTTEKLDAILYEFSKFLESTRLTGQERSEIEGIIDGLKYLIKNNLYVPK